MDAEVWSNADIRNGQRLFPILVLAVLLKEGAVVAGLALGLPFAADLAPPAAFAGGWTPALQAALALGLASFLLVLAFSGRRWALIGFGLIYLLSSGYALWALSPRLWLLPALALPFQPAFVAAGNAVLGLVLGLSALAIPQLRAFIWSQGNVRLVIPLPDDDAPPRRSLRQQRTLGETLIAMGQGAINIVLLLVVLALGAWVYGLGDRILDLLKAF